ncbi:MAG: exonuclease domain-containing protein [Clostridiales bacterium]|nr:exonuclease domain-containing protein [Clostridiales bacterium]
MGSYVVIDLEMCIIPKGICRKTYPWYGEIIQIGAALLNDCCETVSTFKTYVSPEYGTIDRYIEALTGITNDDIRFAPPVRQALSAFMQWVPRDAVFVSWSTADKMQLENETACKNIAVPMLQQYLDTWIDCQQLFGAAIDSKKQYGLTDALILADIDYEMHAHDALVDACNTAKLFAKLKRESRIKLNPLYRSEDDSPAAVHQPFAALKSSFSENK